MSAKYLGVPFDIHGGGKDLIFPHHENERAQSYARFGVEPVKIWVHNDFIRIKGEKMSKSLGNIVRIRDVLQKYDGEVLRYFLLLAHYRSPLDYTEEALERAKRAYEYLRSALVSLDMEIAYLKTFGDRKGGQVDAGNFVKKFEEAMNRDLHTPDAIAALHEFAGFINRSLYDLNLAQAEEIYEAFTRLCGVLGLFENVRRIPPLSQEDAEKVLERERARKEKNFKVADAIRDDFSKRGIRLIDTPKGTRWRVE